MDEEQRRALWAEALGLPPDELGQRDDEGALSRRPKPERRPAPSAGHGPAPHAS